MGLLPVELLSQPPNQEGWVYCTRRFGLLQENWRIKGHFVATMQQALGQTLDQSHFFDTISIKYNNFDEFLKAEGDELKHAPELSLTGFS
jgi:hypothetical protein